MPPADSIAVGVKVFKRTEKLEHLLGTVRDQPIDTVYVADDGDTTDRQHLYDREYPFNLIVLDLEYDAGLGAGRKRIVEALEEPYILFLDSDHTVHDIGPLYDVLTADESLGGVASLMTTDNGEIQANAHDLYETDDGSILVKDIKGAKPTERINSHPVIRFDYVPNAAMYRRECLEEYAWDPEYIIGKDHLDFYLGHKRKTSWEFGICVEALLGHNPGGSESYLFDRLDTRKTWHSKQYFLEKWGYDQIITRRHWSNISALEQSPGAITDGLAGRLGIGSLSIHNQKRLLNVHDLGMRSKAWLYEVLYD